LRPLERSEARARPRHVAIRSSSRPPVSVAALRPPMSSCSPRLWSWSSVSRPAWACSGRCPRRS
jgi:hypothetical protein